MSEFIGYALIAIVVAAILFYGVLALLPGGLSVKPRADRRPFELPADRGLLRADIDRLRIPVTLRGYRFAETDQLIDRLVAEIAVRDAEIGRLRARDDGGFDQHAPLAGSVPPIATDPEIKVSDPSRMDV